MDPVVELAGAVAVLGSFPALAGVDLRVERGEIVLLRGPNGAGKTTMLRVCAGLQPIAVAAAPSSAATSPPQRDAVRRRTGLLGHRNGLYLDLSVTENVRFWGATVGATADELAAAMERLGLAGRLADLPVRRLSAGRSAAPRWPASSLVGRTLAARRAARRTRRRRA